MVTVTIPESLRLEGPTCAVSGCTRGITLTDDDAINLAITLLQSANCSSIEITPRVSNSAHNARIAE